MGGGDRVSPLAPTLCAIGLVPSTVEYASHLESRDAADGGRRHADDSGRRRVVIIDEAHDCSALSEAIGHQHLRAATLEARAVSDDLAGKIGICAFTDSIESVALLEEGDGWGAIGLVLLRPLHTSFVSFPLQLNLRRTSYPSSKSEQSSMSPGFWNPLSCGGWTQRPPIAEQIFAGYL